MIFILFFALSITILLIGSYCLLHKWNKIDPKYIRNEPADNYLFAKEIFVRDPEAFKDKNQDGIDDIINQSK